MSRLVPFVSLSLCLAGVAAAGAQSVPDAVTADPGFHQIAVENEHVRVLRGLAGTGYQTPMHSHPPMVVVSLGTARLRMTAPDGTQQVLDLYPGMVAWFPAVEHSWEVLAGELQAVAVEMKNLPPAAN